MQIRCVSFFFVSGKQSDLTKIFLNTWVKVFRIIPELRILRLTFQ